MYSRTLLWSRVKPNIWPKRPHRLWQHPISVHLTTNTDSGVALSDSGVALSDSGVAQKPNIRLQWPLHLWQHPISVHLTTNIDSGVALSDSGVDQKPNIRLHKPHHLWQHPWTHWIEEDTEIPIPQSPFLYHMFSSAEVFSIEFFLYGLLWEQWLYKMVYYCLRIPCWINMSLSIKPRRG